RRPQGRLVTAATQRGDAMDSIRLDRRSFLRGATVASLGVGAFPAVLRAQPRTIKIGMVEPLTGPMADVGQDSRLGAQIAVEAVKNAGGDKAPGRPRLEPPVADSRTKGGA